MIHVREDSCERFRRFYRTQESEAKIGRIHRAKKRQNRRAIARIGWPNVERNAVPRHGLRRPFRKQACRCLLRHHLSPVDITAAEPRDLESLAQVGAVSNVSQFQITAKTKPQVAPTANVRRRSSPAVVAAYGASSYSSLMK